jgi:signal peptidase II
MLPLLVTIFITLLDQWTKWWVRVEFTLLESREIIPGFFNFTYLRNPGAAWGLFGGHNAFLTILSIVMLGAIFVFRRSFLSDTWEHRLALGLMVGGIIGNLMDRVRFGYVVDFLDFQIAGYHWPIFNVADTAICVGVGIYMVSSIWISSHPLNENRRGESEKMSLPE